MRQYFIIMLAFVWSQTLVSAQQDTISDVKHQWRLSGAGIAITGYSITPVKDYTIYTDANINTNDPSNSKSFYALTDGKIAMLLNVSGSRTHFKSGDFYSTVRGSFGYSPQNKSILSYNNERDSYSYVHTVMTINRNLYIGNVRYAFGYMLNRWRFYIGLEVNFGASFNNGFKHEQTLYIQDDNGTNTDQELILSEEYDAYSSLYGAVTIPMSAGYLFLNEKLMVYGEPGYGQAFERIIPTKNTHQFSTFLVKLGVQYQF